MKETEPDSTQKVFNLENKDEFIQNLEENPDYFLGKFELENIYTVQRGYVDGQGVQLRLYTTKFSPYGTKKASVCIVHGFGEHSGRFLSIADYFAKNGFEVHLIDLRGFGYSGGARGASELEKLHMDVETMIRSASTELPLQYYTQIVLQKYNLLIQLFQRFLYGHSLGGLVVLTLAMRNPDLNIAGIITTSALLGFPKDRKMSMFKGYFVKMVGKKLEDIVVNSMIHPTALTKNNLYIRKCFGDRLMAPFIGLSMAKSILEGTEYAIPNAYKFSKPVLMVHGKLDMVTSHFDSIQFFNKCSSQDQHKELILFDDGYHELQHDQECQELKERVLQWMNKIYQNQRPFDIQAQKQIKKQSQSHSNTLFNLTPLDGSLQLHQEESTCLNTPKRKQKMSVDLQNKSSNCKQTEKNKQTVEKEHQQEQKFIDLELKIDKDFQQFGFESYTEGNSPILQNEDDEELKNQEYYIQKIEQKETNLKELLQLIEQTINQNREEEVQYLDEQQLLNQEQKPFLQNQIQELQQLKNFQQEKNRCYQEKNQKLNQAIAEQEVLTKETKQKYEEEIQKQRLNQYRNQIMQELNQIKIQQDSIYQQDKEVQNQLKLQKQQMNEQKISFKKQKPDNFNDFHETQQSDSNIHKNNQIYQNFNYNSVEQSKYNQYFPENNRPIYHFSQNQYQQNSIPYLENQNFQYVSNQKQLEKEKELRQDYLNNYQFIQDNYNDDFQQNPDDILNHSIDYQNQMYQFNSQYFYNNHCKPEQQQIDNKFQFNRQQSVDSLNTMSQNQYLPQNNINKPYQQHQIQNKYNNFNYNMTSQPKYQQSNIINSQRGNNLQYPQEQVQQFNYQLPIQQQSFKNSSNMFSYEQDQLNRLNKQKNNLMHQSNSHSNLSILQKQQQQQRKLSQNSDNSQAQKYNQQQRYNKRQIFKYVLFFLGIATIIKSSNKVQLIKKFYQILKFLIKSILKFFNQYVAKQNINKLISK
ncbi:hypothetical protein PPERSA_07480 [Pseudocohnilembus persalinus]|uniref:Serine aminopeptidase S33 domain-containing protein n=1 Tax=Pseudocohnilembus persalinus TaxID=266149 RepID=A0A0V0R2C2_PSEPJ|nr:hypothetical protein PPERSA_07480 [Pseudocohnilembus persalinus]|eukprot:KRX08668.1 hypothetical protein PPERSA_07480 [Pseudocohnilembus persalinus]